MQTTNLSNVWGTRTSSTQATSVDRLRRTAHSQEQALFLHRFQALLAKRHQHIQHLQPTDWRLRLIDKALYSTYQDCLDLTLGDEVREILRRDRGESAE